MPKNNIFPIRLDVNERRILEEKSRVAKFSNLTSYIRHLLLSKNEPEELILIKEIHNKVCNGGNKN